MACKSNKNTPLKLNNTSSQPRNENNSEHNPASRLAPKENTQDKRRIHIAMEKVRKLSWLPPSSE
jgi:hypothetical protein